MKMSMDIDPELLEQVKQLSGQKAQATAVNHALKEWVRLKSVERLHHMIKETPFSFTADAEELRALNQTRGVGSLSDKTLDAQYK